MSQVVSQTMKHSASSGRAEPDANAASNLDAEARGICEVSPQELAAMQARGEALIVDVREPEEYAREHIEGAINIPLSKVEPGALPDAGEKIIVLHCRSGVRSEQAAKALLSGGCDAAHHLKGGIKAWRQAGLSVVENRKVPISIIRQVQIVAGLMVVAGTLLGTLVNPWWLLLSGFVGAGLTFAGLTGTCGLAVVLGKMPWNQIHTP